MPQPIHRIRKMKVRTVSLVPLGANDMPVVYKSADQTVELQCVSKMADDEKGELLSVVYAPDRVDQQGHFASAEVIKEAAHGWLADGAAIDILHDNKPLSRSRVAPVESFTVQKGDVRFEGWVDVNGKPLGSLEGAWAAIFKINDPALRKLYREGKWNGVSLAGPAELELQQSANTDDVLRALADALRKSTTEPKVPDMTPAELEAALAKSNAALAEVISTSIAKALAPKAEATPTPPVTPKITPEPDLTDPKVVAKMARDKRIELLKANVDWNDPESIEAYQGELAKLTAAPTKERPASRVAGGDADLTKGAEFSDSDRRALGLEMAGLLATSSK